jgi:hypothetical protein
VPALILDRVVKQPGNGLRLGAAALDDQARHRQQMADVGDVAALAGLRAVKLGGVRQGLVEPLGQFGCGGLLWHLLPVSHLTVA